MHVSPFLWLPCLALSPRWTLAVLVSVGNFALCEPVVVLQEKQDVRTPCLMLSQMGTKPPGARHIEKPFEAPRRSVGVYFGGLFDMAGLAALCQRQAWSDMSNKANKQINR